MAQQPRESVSVEVFGVSTDVEVEEIPALADKPVDITRVRRDISYVILGLFALTVLLSFVAAIWSDDAWLRTKELLQIVAPIEGFLLGATKDHWLPKRTD